MIVKAIVGWFLLFTVVFSYTEQNGILVLKNEDLVNITKIFPKIFIDYYVPWCQHCQKLAPIISEIAQTLKQQVSPIRIATIDCNQNEDAYDFAQLTAFPTLIYYQDEQPTHFDGDRTKNYLQKWLNKRISSPVKQITLAEFQRLKISEENQVSVVFVGTLSSVKGAKFLNIAYQDNYNEYYFIPQEIKPYGTVLLLRSFAEDVYYESSEDENNLYDWIIQHDRPTVVPLDDRSISAVFRDGKIAVFLFIDQKHINKTSIFEQAANNWKRQKKASEDLIFITVTEQHEDFFGLLEYLQINPLQSPIVIINAQLETKYIFNHKILSLNTTNIIEFIQHYQNGNIKSQTLNNQVHQHDHHHHHDHDHDHDHHHHHHDHDHDHDHHHHHNHHDHDHNHDHHHEHQQNHGHQHINMYDDQKEHNNKDHDHIGDDCPHKSHSNRHIEQNIKIQDSLNAESLDKQIKQQNTQL